MGERLGAKETDACNEGVCRRDEWVDDPKLKGGILNLRNRSLEIRIGGFGLEESEEFTGLRGIGCLIRVVLEVRSVLLFGSGNERLVWFGEGATDALGKGQTDFLLKCTSNECLFWVDKRKFDIINPTGVRLERDKKVSLTIRSISM